MNEAAGQRCAARKVLVACLGNPDRGDDGVGAMVARLLESRLPDDARLVVRSGDMMALLEDWAGCDAVVCVDAAATMGAPGRIHRIDLARDEAPANGPLASSHAFGLADAIRLGDALGERPATIIVYAVEGACFDGGAPMTAAVATAVGEAARRVIAEVRRLRQSGIETTASA